MVPTEKKKKADMLHEYIKFHKLKKHNHAPRTGINLVTGQSDRLKTEYAAVSMFPQERVNKLLI